MTWRDATPEQWTEAAARARKAQQAMDDLGVGAKCPTTVTIKTSPFRGETRLYRCDRERNHEGQHHGAQKDESEMFWGADGKHAEGEAHDYALVCKVCGQPGVIRVSVDPNFPDADLIAKVKDEFGG
jgi:hypothetical protein